MKFRVVQKYIIVAAIGLIIFSVGSIIMVLLSKSTSINEYDILFILFFSLMILVGIVGSIVCSLYYVEIANNAIRLFWGKKLKREISQDSIKKIIVWQINFHGVQNECIIFDDGTFCAKEFANKKPRSKKTGKKKGWISIAYSPKYISALTIMLPNCPIETITPDQY